MTIQCRVSVSGTPADVSVRNFTQSIEKGISSQYIKKYQNTLTNDFQRYISDNMRRAGMEGVQDLEKTFFVNITGQGIVFGTTEPLIANRYEYGWESDDDYDESDYAISTSPRYFMRPAIYKVMQKLGARIKQDIYEDYIKESHNAGYSNYILPEEKHSSSYLNKYSGLL